MKLPKETGKNIRVKSSRVPKHMRIKRGGAGKAPMKPRTRRSRGGK